MKLHMLTTTHPHGFLRGESFLMDDKMWRIVRVISPCAARVRPFRWYDYVGAVAARAWHATWRWVFG